VGRVLVQHAEQWARDIGAEAIVGRAGFRLIGVPQRWSKVMAWFGERILTPNDSAGPKSL
jgi:GNAT superfamily N-acetyltransferase